MSSKLRWKYMGVRVRSGSGRMPGWYDCWLLADSFLYNWDSQLGSLHEFHEIEHFEPNRIRLLSLKFPIKHWTWHLFNSDAILQKRPSRFGFILDYHIENSRFRSQRIMLHNLCRICNLDNAFFVLSQMGFR